MSAKPFLKWVGGKRQLLPELLKRVPETFGTYYEPFLGGGALFFALRPCAAVLGDANPRLVATYRGVRRDVDEVVRLLREYPNDEAFFLAMRSILSYDVADDARTAARFIYLNKTCFNGLYRENRKGEFNVPFGRYANPTICDEEALRKAEEALRRVVSLQVGDFEATASGAREGDFAYFDPPYVPLSATSSFVGYTGDGFGLKEQVRLRDLAARLKARGVRVLLSNSSAPLVRELYAERLGFRVEEVSARRAVSAKASGRKSVPELLIS